MADPFVLSASDVALALSDPFGLWHDHHGDPRLKDPEDEYALFLKEQGLRIEKELLKKRHGPVVDLTDRPFGAAAMQTGQLLKYGHVVIYGGAIESGALGLRARPDVIQVEKGRSILEEYKLAGTPDETHEIQALVYAYLLRRGYGIENESRVVSRLNEEFAIPYDEPRVVEAVRRAREIVAAERPPYPVYNRTSRWRRLQNKAAHDLQDVTLTWNVGAVHAEKFHRMGVHTLGDLVQLNPNALKTIKGLGPKKIPQILNSAKSQLSKRVIRVGPYEPLDDPPEVELFLDLEGTGELFQDDPAWNCIYLIGLTARAGGREAPYLAYLAKKPEDEKKILAEFFEYLRKETRRYRLYHWDHYEKTQLRKASERHGFLDDFNARVQPHLEDLCKAAQASYILPTPGYSIKVVAPYFGFHWSQDASEVDAMKSAMIWYKQAVEGGTGHALEKVLKYNEDDCKAMIVVKDGFEKLARAG
ncbi:MAG TPA: TM0106 family RecB-like putative nuclease [Nitrospiria bacterium]|nr:TM0106 family RecB-like putative nuclease [Nitrospiria bacterium]